MTKIKVIVKRCLLGGIILLVSLLLLVAVIMLASLGGKRLLEILPSMPFVGPSMDRIVREVAQQSPLNLLTAIIAGGLVTTLISLLVMWWTERRVKQAYLHGRVKLPPDYLERSKAEVDMHEGMKKARHMVFLGLSHNKLAEHIEEVLKTKTEEHLDWRNIEVFFADDAIGNVFSGSAEKFGSQIVQAVRDISYRISCNRRKLPQLESIVFYQRKLPTIAGGSLFFSTDHGGPDKADFYEGYFHVHHGELTRQLTWRVTDKAQEEGRRQLRNMFFDYYIESRGRYRPLYCYRPCEIAAWDESADLWDQFQRDHLVYGKIMQKLLKLAEVKETHSVLDLGCGSGVASKAIADCTTKGFFLLLDSSPVMVHKTKENMSQYSHVDCILADARKFQMLYGNYGKKKFDRIISHFSFHHFVDTNHSVATLASRWKKYLEPNGEVIIAIHNSFIQNCPRPEGWQNWEDPLRQQLTELARNKNIELRETNGGYKFGQNEIKDGFELAGFQLVNSLSEDYERTFADRVSMWMAPAVHGVLVNCRDREKVRELLEEVYKKLNNERGESMPTTVFFYRFGVK